MKRYINIKRCIKIIGNVFFIIIDIVLIGINILLCILAVLFLCGILGGYDNIINDIVNTILRKQIDTQDFNMINIFGVLSACAITPYIGVIFNIYRSNKSSHEAISKFLAETQNISMCLIPMPLGAWYSLVVMMNKNIKQTLPAISYDYCISLGFKLDCLQAYELDVKELVIDSQKINRNDLASYYTDATGVDAHDNQTLLSILINENDKLNSNQIENMKRIAICINMWQRKDAYKNTIDGMFKREDNFLYPFPLIRFFFKGMDRLWQKRKCHEIELILNPVIKEIKRQNTSYEYEIIDINITQTRK